MSDETAEDEVKGNERRLVIRLAAEDDDWLGQQGKTVGIGKSVVARILIQWANRKGVTLYQLMAWMAKDAAQQDQGGVDSATVAALEWESAADGLDIEAVVATQAASVEPAAQTYEESAYSVPPPTEGGIRPLRVVPREAGKAWAGG